MNFTTVSVLRGADNITINMEGANVTAFPFLSFSWTIDNFPAMNSTAVTFGFPTVTFQIVDSTFSSSYSLFATNYFVDEPTRVLGSSTGSFTLDVLCEFKHQCSAWTLSNHILISLIIPNSTYNDSQLLRQRRSGGEGGVGSGDSSTPFLK